MSFVQRELQWCRLWVQCPWVNSQYIEEKEEAIHPSVQEAALEGAKGASVVHDEVMEKMGKQWGLWIQEMTEFKNVVAKALLWG